MVKRYDGGCCDVDAEDDDNDDDEEEEEKEDDDDILEIPTCPSTRD